VTIVDEGLWGASAATVAAVERELARLRRAAGAHAREQGHTLARAAVLNLVVYADREVHAARAARAVGRLALRHPSRAIVVWADREQRGEGARADLHCHVPRVGERAQICYEQILLRMSGDDDARIRSLVIPLLVPDLPVFLWWTDSPPRARRFDDLLGLADRLVVDSADFARPEVTLARLAALVRTSRTRRCSVTDLNWTRLTPWRELVAQFFDVEAWRPFLDEMIGVRIGFGVDMDGRDIHPSQALLFLGWLASRLGWRPLDSLAPSEAGGLLFRMSRGDGAPIMVRVRPRFERGVEAGDTSGIRLQCRRGRELAEFVLKRAPDERHVTATVVLDGNVRSLRVVPLAARSVDDLMAEELTIVGSDRIYEAALGALMALA
jgi:glucose-6-phosphate dehydrogenase assembly protein OpcA